MNWTLNSSSSARCLFNAVNDRRRVISGEDGGGGAPSREATFWSLNEVTKSTSWSLAEPELELGAGALSEW